MKSNSTKIDPFILMPQKVAQQAAKERAISLKWNMASLLLTYAFINLVLFLDHNEYKAIHLSIVAVVGLAGIILISSIRERNLARREAEHLKLILSPLSPPEDNLKLEISPDENSGLTGRELEILSFVIQGRSDKEIATKLNLSQYTVRNHLRNIYRKLEVKDRTSAAVVALNLGWIKLTEDQREEKFKTENVGVSLNRLGKRLGEIHSGVNSGNKLKV